MEDDTVTVEAMQMCAEHHSQETHMAIQCYFTGLLLLSPQTNYNVDWLADVESHFLGHVIGTMWPINNLYTTVT